MGLTKDRGSRGPDIPSRILVEHSLVSLSHTVLSSPFRLATSDTSGPFIISSLSSVPATPAMPSYDPLPLTPDDPPANSLYNAPSSPDHHPSAFHTPSSRLTDLGPDMLPAGAAAPRFLGAALYEDAPRNRDSFASSNNTLSSPVGGSEYNSSLYAFNVPDRVPLDSSYRDDPRDDMPMSPVGQSRLLEEKRAAYVPPRVKSRRRALILGVLAALVLLIVAVIIPIYFAIIKPKTSGSQRDSNGPSPTRSSQGPIPTKVAIVTGGDGSTVTMDDGTTFTYANKFGGYWYYDKNDPFNNGAQAQSWTPALNETFNYGIDKIRGYVDSYYLVFDAHCFPSVNLGGWLNTEPVRFRPFFF